MTIKIKSCSNCPSYIEDQDVILRRFKKSTGAPMCGRYGHVLGQPSRDNEEVCQSFASKCDAYDKPLGETPVSINPRVFKPHPSAFDPAAASAGAITSAGTAPDKIGTCNACSNQVNAAAIVGSSGWVTGACMAKGTLILSPMGEARDCPWARKGDPRNDLPIDVELIDEFKVGFRVRDEVRFAALKSLTEWVEPTTYKTDQEVSSEDADKGIRAWRRYVDSETGNDYFMPIFRRDFFTEEEQKRIPVTGVPFGATGAPELYVDHNGLLMSFLKDSYMLDETLCLTGEPGNGKTQFGIYLAWLTQLPFEKFAIRPDMDVENFLGHPSVDPVKGDYYYLGRMPRRFQRPGVVVSDEYNAGPEDISFLYRDMLDTGKVRIDYEEGLTVDKDDYLFHLVTMNPNWDMRNLGTRQLADADEQRLSFAWVAEPPEPILRSILTEWCKRDDYDLPKKTLDKIIAIGVDIRELSKQGVYPGSWGLRQEIKVARKTAHYASLVDCYKRAALDAVEPEAAQLVIQAIESQGG